MIQAIQVKEVSANKAALQIADLLDAEQGAWLVNAVDDEGFVLAREGSPLAKRMQRSRAPTLTGPFDARWRVCYIAEDLREAQLGDRRVRAVKAPPRNHAPRSRMELMARIAEMLGTGEQRVADIERHTGVSARTVREALARMKQGGEVAKRRDRNGQNFYSPATRERKAA